MPRRLLPALFLLAPMLACSEPAADPRRGFDAGAGNDASRVADVGPDADTDDFASADLSTADAGPRDVFTVVTFNTGTGPGSHHDQGRTCQWWPQTDAA